MLQRFVALIQTKYCSEASTAATMVQVRTRRVERDKQNPNNSSEEEDVGEFGHIVYSPENLTHPQRSSPDWGALAASQQSRPVNFDPYFLDPHRAFGNTLLGDLGGGNNGRSIDFIEDDDFADNLQGDDGVFHQTTVALSPRLVRAYCGNVSRTPRDVVCRPAPDAFNPCEDLMGNWWLRAAVWVVVVAAVLGNSAVLVVLLSSRFRMTVPKFLMCNLALADLIMGIYLLLIAAMDAVSIGAYFNHAIDWQEGKRIIFFCSSYLFFTLRVDFLSFIRPFHE